MTKSTPKSSATPSTVKRKRKAKSDLNRLDVTKQLFPQTPSSKQNTKPEPRNKSPFVVKTPKTGVFSSPSKTKKTNSSKRSKTWGPRSARKARALKELQRKRNQSGAKADVKMEALDQTTSSTPIKKRQPKHEKVSEVGASADGSTISASVDISEKNNGAVRPSEDRGMSPDENLEDMMLSLDDSNTFSPTKITPSKVRIPYYLANVRVALGEVMNSPFDVRYFNLDDVSSISIFHCCEGLCFFYDNNIRKLLSAWLDICRISFSVLHMDCAIEKKNKIDKTWFKVCCCICNHFA